MATRLLVLLTFWYLNEGKPNYCVPTNTSCWPTETEINSFSKSLQGSIYLPSDPQYTSYWSMTQDTLYINQYPSFIVVCNSAADIQSSVLFASSHNIQISICSTGHSYSGRNTANYSIQINLSKMVQYSIAKNNASITVETGLRWGTIYGLVNTVDRIIVGASDPGVGPAGYSMNGGHSPLSPHYGLSSDFTLEYYMVDANANIIHVYNTSGGNQTVDDLFWALRGGGGGTFGVIVNITFMLHEYDQPVSENKLTQFYCTYRFWEHPYALQNRGRFLGDMVLNNMFDLVRTGEIDENWGGFVLKDTFVEGFVFDWLFYGNTTFAAENIQPMFGLNYPYNNSENYQCNLTVFDTYYDYQKDVPPVAPVWEYLFNSLVPKENLTQNYANLIMEFFNSSNLYVDGYGTLICWIFQGGKVNERDNDYTSVTPAFRSNIFEMAFTTFTNGSYSNSAIQNAQKYEPKLREYGLGIYGNEENYDCFDCNWKQQFWGNHYDKLLAIKQIYDPNQVFWCHHCVGDE